MKVLHRFKKTIEVHLDRDEREKAVRLLNLHYLNDEECNVQVDKKGDGYYMPKYPEKETLEFLNSHYNAARAYGMSININLMEDGTLQLE